MDTAYTEQVDQPFRQGLFLQSTIVSVAEKVCCLRRWVESTRNGSWQSKLERRRGSFLFRRAH